MTKNNLKKILYIAITLVLIAAVYLLLRNLSYFRLDTIEVIDKSGATKLNSGELLKIYKDRNIFGIDITSLSSQIKRDFPAIKDAIVRKAMPNKLEIDIVPRNPIARIKSRGYFPIDRTGVVLSPEMKTANLPVIIGVAMWMSPRVGTKLKNVQIMNAFLLIDALEKSSVLSDYAVTTIDASNYRNLSFYLQNGIEVKIGGEDFLDRLNRLKEIFANPKLDKENMKYIDLRFTDVVIGPK